MRNRGDEGSRLLVVEAARRLLARRRLQLFGDFDFVVAGLRQGNENRGAQNELAGDPRTAPTGRRTRPRGTLAGARARSTSRPLGSRRQRGSSVAARRR